MPKKPHGFVLQSPAACGRRRYQDRPIRQGSAQVGAQAGAHAGAHLEPTASDERCSGTLRVCRGLPSEADRTSPRGDCRGDRRGQGHGRLAGGAPQSDSQQHSRGQASQAGGAGRCAGRSDDAREGGSAGGGDQGCFEGCVDGGGGFRWQGGIATTTWQGGIATATARAASHWLSAAAGITRGGGSRWRRWWCGPKP